ncbi:MAG: arabinan endo-1,5-alpha-L-arabinosidase, partial [Tannerellaceae bacterium]|nr:arabinan endo-1,5-alpha-L-arabinosidase [Tannerellaceae bacterium]
MSKNTFSGAAMYMAAILLTLISCRTERAALTPVNSANPWPDDYRSVSGMEHYTSWGVYNVHDPACFKVGDTFYMYSTDAIYHEPGSKRADELGIKEGNIQVRKSKDLVNWEFAGWAFDGIPEEAVAYVRANMRGRKERGATNIWAPFPIQYKDKYRLYYCVSAFAQSVSYLGLAESDSPEGPWELKGCVVKTDSTSRMNAIDPSVIITENGEHWMHYGSYFGGLFCLQLDPETGLAMREGDQGHLVATRANRQKDNIEAPEILYHPEFNQYYLFVSYDPLMTTYNVRVGRSDKPEGPFYDIFGADLAEETNNYPVLTHPYRFENHPGWAGTGHCGVVQDEGRYFMMHQGRLSPDNQLMVLHLREMFWTAEGWPVVSPERYAGIPQEELIAADFIGDWEIILVRDSKYERDLWAGQILWGEGELQKEEVDVSTRYTFTKEGQVQGEQEGTWSYHPRKGLCLELGGEKITGLIPHIGQD